MNNYIWQVEDHFPKSDAELWKMMDGRTVGYYQAVKIRDFATATGKELKTNFLTENRYGGNYAVLDYM